MWQKTLIIFFLLLFFILLQNSFFAVYNFFGAVPNLVFDLFFLLIFFEKKFNFLIVFTTIVAGFILDVSYFSYIGPSIILLLLIGILLKKTQSSLKNAEDDYPFSYFLPLFLVYFIIYKILLMAYISFFDISHTPMVFNLLFLVEIFYNLLFVSAFFCVYKKCQKFIK